MDNKEFKEKALLYVSAWRRISLKRASAAQISGDSESYRTERAIARAMKQLESKIKEIGDEHHP